MSSTYFKNGGSAGSSFTNNRSRRLSLQSDDASPKSIQDYFPKQSESMPRSCPASLDTESARITTSINPPTPSTRLTTAQENQIFADKSSRLLSFIHSTSSILTDLRDTNKNRFLIYYPTIDANPTFNQNSKLSRSLSFAQDAHESSPSDATPRDYLRRVHSMSSPSSPKDAISTTSLADQLSHRILNPETAQAFNSQLNVLKLDLKVGNLTTDLGALEKESISALLDDRLAQSIKHLDNLHSRVADKSSKVLVTGDLNAGKSTFVNALLRRDLMPTDQQPCTTLFCEVLNATENDGVEEVHAVPDAAKYKRDDPATYDKVDIRHLYKHVTDGNEQYTMLKVYTTDKRSTQESLLHNGIVDIALIDSPGLNRDSLKTTALFARQEEIDVVVFVVSAENHFTLSGKEFLWNAANEKAHIFIVVNRFDGIKDKERCKRVILEQIRQLSPATYADADELVHFVSSGDVQLDDNAGEPSPESFAQLEQRLRAFVLENRSRSKLSPAKYYLQNVLSDVGVLSGSNHDSAANEYERATHELEANRPAYERLIAVRDRVLEDVERLAEDTVHAIQTYTKNRIDAVVDHIESAVASVEYPGIHLIWQYAYDLRDSMLYAVQKEVRTCNSHAGKSTVEAVDKMYEIGREHLNENENEYECNIDVDAQFIRCKTDHAFVVSIEAMDFLDFNLEDKLPILSMSFGSFGAATLFGGKIFGFRGLMSSVWNVSSVVGVNNARRWIVPVASLAGLGLVAYLVADMRHAVERKLARKVRNHLRDAHYSDTQAYRIARASRKALRLAGWDLNTRFQRAVEAQEQQRENQTRVAKVSGEAAAYFAEVLAKAEELAMLVGAVETEGLRIK